MKLTKLAFDNPGEFDKYALPFVSNSN